MAYSPLSVQNPFKVYVETTPVVGADGWRKYDGDGEAIAWVETEELRPLRISDVSGRVPSTAVLEYLGGGTAPLRTGGGYTASTGLDAQGNPAGAIVKPSVCGLMDMVRIVECVPAEGEEEAYEKPIFQGLVVGIAPDWTKETTAILCADWRWLMARTPVLGWTYYYLAGEAEAHEFLQESLAVFNPKGLPNRYAGPDVATYPASICGESSVHSGHWARAHVWNGLRWHFSTNVPTDAGEELVNSTAHYMAWPALEEEGHGGGLFGDCVWPDLALGGKYLDQALELLARRGAGYDWWVRPPEPGEDLSTLELYGTAPDTIEAGQEHISLARGELYKSPAQSPREVLGGSPAWDAGQVALEVIGLGARKKFDLSFDTVSGTLVKDWTSTQRTAWLGLSLAERRRQYRNVFRRFVVPDDVDWVGEYGWPVGVLRQRLAGAQLLSIDSATVGADGRPVRLRAQIWRSADSGSSWEELPADRGTVSILPSGIGVELAEAAREKPWTWDGTFESPAEYDLRITVSVEGDERLMPGISAIEGTDWPRLTRLVLAEQFGYEARREAYMNASGSPAAPVMDGGTATLFGDGADDEIRDDTGQLAELMGQVIDQLGRLGRSGPIPLKGIRTDIRPGMVLDDVTGGGTGRPDEPFDTVIRRVTYEFGDHPKTTVYVEAD